MSEWKKRRYIDDFFSEEFEKIEEIMERLIKDMFDESELRGNTNPLLVGFSVKMDEKGRPRIQEFGNITTSPEAKIVAKVREPLVDVTDCADDITITAELPGAERKDVDIIARKNRVIISVERPVSFYKEIDLIREIVPQSMKASMKNGILEVVMQKAPQKKSLKAETKN